MSRFLIIGAGGIGGWLARGLVPIAEYRAPGSVVMIIDGDQYEDKNRERQLFKEIGNKADVLAAEFQESYNNTYVIPMAAWVVSDEVAEKHNENADPEEEELGIGKIAASQLLEDGDVVYAVVDNFKARKELIDAAAKLDNCDVFLGGNDDKLYGSVYHYQRRDGEDVIRNPVERHPELANPGDRNPGELSCQERAEIEGGTQLICTNMAVAAWLLGRTQHTIIEGNEEDQAEIIFDLAQGLARPSDRKLKKTLVSTN